MLKSSSNVENRSRRLGVDVASSEDVAEDGVPVPHSLLGG
jgi:hypothetical protein